jgi:hypothetical protein
MKKGRIKMTKKEILDELSISVACLLDDLEDIKQEDIEHIQNLVTRLEMKNWEKIKRGA